MNQIRIEQLSEKNFSDYESLTREETNGKTGCYCAFWHQKWNSMDEWERRQKEEPLKNRDIMKSKMHAGHHVGALAYLDNKLLAWISISPLPEFYWTWRRVVQVGNEAPNIAGITCINVAPEFRNQGYQAQILKELANYAREKKWNIIEGYPFDESAVKVHAEKVFWPGLTNAFVEAGFKRVEAHWLSQGEWARSIFRLNIT